jgi:uncharacterized membrane protein YphA (DoxX/SURF4 family)
VQNNTLGIQKAASTFERAMTGRVMHSIAFLTLCAAYIQGGLSKLSNIATSLAEMDRFHLHPAGFWPQSSPTELVGSAMVISGRGRWVGALWLAGFTFIANLLANAFWTVQGAARFPQENAFFEHWGLIGGLLLVAWIDLHDLAYRSRGAEQSHRVEQVKPPEYWSRTG